MDFREKDREYSFDNTVITLTDRGIIKDNKNEHVIPYKQIKGYNIDRTEHDVDSILSIGSKINIMALIIAMPFILLSTNVIINFLSFLLFVIGIQLSIIYITHKLFRNPNKTEIHVNIEEQPDLTLSTECSDYQQSIDFCLDLISRREQSKDNRK